jgi:hypothetical protein
MKRIVLFVEGEGESVAVPNLVRRLLSEKCAWDTVLLDDNPFRVGEVTRLLKNDCAEWKRKLAASLKRKQVGGVLLLLDGDLDRVGGTAFCAAAVARSLAKHSTSVGGGQLFSVAVVFARQEFESWLIAGFDRMQGKQLADGRLISNPKGIVVPQGDLEASPRNAKGWLSNAIEGGYKPTRDQSALTDLLDFDAIRQRQMRSFRRLESALDEIVSAIRSKNHIASPAETEMQIC